VGQYPTLVGQNAPLDTWPDDYRLEGHRSPLNLERYFAQDRGPWQAKLPLDGSAFVRLQHTVPMHLGAAIGVYFQQCAVNVVRVKIDPRATIAALQQACGVVEEGGQRRFRRPALVASRSFRCHK
jgi:hypothetical protein